MDEKQKAGLNALEKAGYLPALRELAMSLCAPFYWSIIDEKGQAKILHNGTICYFHSGERFLGVTANHAYQQYLDDNTQFEGVEVQFGGSTIVPEDRLIARDAALDLATFDVPEVFVTAGHKSVHYPQKWPTDRIQKGEVVLYGGYPGVLRKLRPGQADFAFQSFAWALSDVTDANMLMHVDFANLHWPGHEHEKINENPGGVSGGPVFRVIEGLVDRIELVGFIYEYLTPFETMRARHGDRVLPDGKLVSL